MSGKIKKRGDSYSVVIALPDDPVTGRRRQKRITRPTKREVEIVVAETLHAANQGTFADAGKLTVRDYLERWLESIAPPIRKPSTYRRYSDLLRLHVIPNLGGVKLDKLSPLAVDRLYKDRLAAGLSPTTVHQIHNVLHKGLAQAIRWGLLTRNVTESVDAPQPVNPECKTWDTLQVARVLSVCAGDDLETLWRLALLTGMRRGEILGLLWPDIDFDQQALSVRRTLTRGTGGSWEFGSPKTAHGQRRITLPSSLVDSLRQHRLRQIEQRLALGEHWEDHDFVFTNGFGGPLHPNSLALRFRRLTERAQVPTIRFHDLRHTSATLMLANGEHPKIVQERLGHSDVGITLNRYSHVSIDMQHDAAARLDAVLAKARDLAS